jgi:hypothetical protein
MLDKLAALPEDLSKPETLLADTGYFSATRGHAIGRAEIYDNPDKGFSCD